MLHWRRILKHQVMQGVGRLLPIWFSHVYRCLCMVPWRLPEGIRKLGPAKIVAHFA